MTAAAMSVPARPVVLATINARYVHAALGLRYLLANAGDVADRITLVELVSGQPIERMAERLLAVLGGGRPRIAAFGVYIWNVVQTEALIRRLKAEDPELVVILGGPEVSHELADQPIATLAEHVIQGPGDVSFGRLVGRLLDGRLPDGRLPDGRLPDGRLPDGRIPDGRPPPPKVIAGEQPDLAALALPYDLYGEHDLRARTVYVEASRGCPFRCAFCLSALDRTAWPFPLPAVLAALARLHRRGARRFKFVDRTFNLKPATSVAILGFFLERIEAAPDDPCFVHFELVPDHLPDALKAAIARFPAGTLQFEIGIQTFDPAVQKLIDRRQDDERAEANLRWLRAHSQAHLHVDLIAGLPGETLASFAAGFDRLIAIDPHEIQLGLLKRLRGAPIARHTVAHRLDFDPAPPYTIRSTAAMPAATLAAIAVAAHFLGRIRNAGRMPRLAALVFAGAPFARLLALATALERRFGRRHAIGLEALVEAVVDWLAEHGPRPRAEVEALAVDDYRASGARGRLAFMPRGLSGAAADAGRPRVPAALPARQRRHEAAGQRPFAQ